MEQLQQHVHGLEHLRPLVLVDEIELRGGVQLARHDRVVEIRLDVRERHLLEGDGPSPAKTKQVEEPVTALRGVGAALDQFGKAVFELSLKGRTLLRRDAGQLIADKAIPKALDRFGVLDCHLLAPRFRKSEAICPFQRRVWFQEVEGRRRVGARRIAPRRRPFRDHPQDFRFKFVETILKRLVRLAHLVRLICRSRCPDIGNGLVTKLPHGKRLQPLSQYFHPALQAPDMAVFT